MVNGTEPAGGSGRAVVRSAQHVKGSRENIDVRALRDPVVVKLGGCVLADRKVQAQLAVALRRVGAPIVLVHGGGADVTAWCRRLGVATTFQDGLRVTDPQTLDVAVAILAGLTNKTLTARLQADGVDAAGMSALDGGMVEVAPHANAALGAVGAVRAVNTRLLRTLLADGCTPVLASIGASDGALLNLNADHLAAAVAAAFPARALVFVSDTPGVRLDDVVVRRIERGALETLRANAHVGGGMRPKLEAAQTALDAGVPRVHIGAWSGPETLSELLSNDPPGTQLLPGTPAPGLEVAHG